MDKPNTVYDAGPQLAIEQLPVIFQKEKFSLLKRGIYDEDKISVYVNDCNDFAFLYPRPTVDYKDYTPRHVSLKLSSYKNKRRVSESRYEKLEKAFPCLFDTATKLLEIGSSSGDFLALLRDRHPTLELTSIEPDQATSQLRAQIAGLNDFQSIQAASASGVSADLICLFHVFEHLAQPDHWLQTIKKLLRKRGSLVIEVPSMSDPLLSLYNSSEYQNYYFQKQHPYVYTGLSLKRVLESNGFEVQIVAYQRYGIENHLMWLSKGIAGGSDLFRDIFADTEEVYRADLESSGLTDTVIALARKID